MEIFNPYKIEPQVATASASNTKAETAVASTFTVEVENMCPKCGSTMMPARLFNNVSVHHCGSCRVSHPRSS